MKRFFFVGVIVLALFPLAFGQSVIKDFNTDDFPNVSFTVHTTSPEKLTKDNIRVLEEGAKVPVTKCDVASKNQIKNCNVLFLWDYRGNVGQQFPLELLGDLFKNKKSDNLLKANVAVFMRTPKGEKDYHLLNDAFSNNFQKTWSLVVSEGEKGMSNNALVSDISWALMKSIEQLGKVKEDGAKAIVLITSGKDDPEAGINASTIVEAAKKHQVSIYVVNIDAKDADKNFGESLSSATHGKRLASAGKFVDTNRTALQERNEVQYLYTENESIDKWLTELPLLHSGIDYRVTFTSHLKRVGQSKQISVDANGETINTSYNVPGGSFGLWIKTHLLLFCILLFVLLTLLGLGLFFFIRRRRNAAAEKQEEEERLERERKQLKSEQETLRRRIDLADSEKRQKQAQQLSGEKKAKHQEQINTINRLMVSKNVRARLLLFSMTGQQEATICTAETTIGTADDNNIVVEDPTVSRHHAMVYYNGEDFYIKDTDSTNGLVMNGIKIQDLKLRNGDAVKMGNTTLKFYF